MTIKDEALLKYLEFNLICMVNNIKPHLKDGVDEQEIYELANVILDEMRETISQPSGLKPEINKKT